MIPNANTSIELLTLKVESTGTCVVLYCIRAAFHTPAVPGTVTKDAGGMVAVPPPLIVKPPTAAVLQRRVI